MRRFPWLVVVVALSVLACLPSTAAANSCGTQIHPASVTIPNGSLTPISSSMYVRPGQTPGGGTLEDVNARVTIVQPNNGDLSITLAHNGKTVTLLSAGTASGSNLTSTVFDDQAAGAITTGSAPYRGTFKPAQALSAFDDGPIGGVWTLSVRDSVGEAAPRRAGAQTLVSWGVNPSTQSCADGLPVCDGSISAVGIPLSDGGSISSSRRLVGAGSVTGVTATIDVNHPADGDVYASLAHAGTTVPLVTHRGGTGDDFVGTTFDDTAITAISAGSAPFSGSFKPETPLGALNSGSTNGDWTIKIGDDVVNSVTGTVVSTGLTVTTTLCVDPDGDVIYSAIDNCPAVANVGQENYTPFDGEGDACDADDDNDGYDDTADACPQGSTGPGVDFDRDGCQDAEDPDDDNDAVADAADACPQGAIGPGGDTDGDGCKDFEDADDDADGVPDTADNCPAVANPTQVNTDGDAQGDACDADDDGDGIVDEADPKPLDASQGPTGDPLTGGDAPTTAPAITRLKLTPTRFAAARSGASTAKKRKKAAVGTTVSYTADQPSTTTVTVVRVRPGIKKGATCVKRKKGAKGKACSRLTTMGTLSRSDPIGSITFRFTGRLKGKALRVGTYRLKVRGANVKGSGTAVSRRFKIIKR